MNCTHGHRSAFRVQLPIARLNNGIIQVYGPVYRLMRTRAGGWCTCTSCPLKYYGSSCAGAYNHKFQTD
eukprot:1140927-Pelagomonas_calceolata.AAC.7